MPQHLAWHSSASSTDLVRDGRRPTFAGSSDSLNALTAAAGVDLRLDDPDRARPALSRWRLRLLRRDRRRRRAGTATPILFQQVLRLIFVNIHD